MGNNGNNVKAGALLALGIAAVIGISGFAGYKTVTRYEKVDGAFDQAADLARNKIFNALGFDPDKKARQVDQPNPDGTDNTDDIVNVKNSPYEDGHQDTYKYSYRIQGSRNYHGTTIYRAGGYIYNSDGKILKDHYDKDRYYPNMYLNIDRSKGILLENNICYIIDDQLELTKIAENVVKAGISYDGSHCYYIKSSPNDRECLYNYDMKTGEEVLICEGVIFATISPNGRTMCYDTYDSNGQYLAVSGFDIETFRVTEGTTVVPVTVSNDGEIVYYQDISGDDKEKGFYCKHKDKSFHLTRDYVIEAYFDRDLKSVIFAADAKLQYFGIRLYQQRNITERRVNRVTVSGVGFHSIDSTDEMQIVDTTCLSDVLTFYDDKTAYCLKGDIPETVEMVNDALAPIAVVTKKGPAVLYSDGQKLVKRIYNGIETTDEVIFEDSEKIYANFAANEDLSEIWVESKSYDAIVYIKEGEEPKAVAPLGGRSINDIIYYHFDKCCYYVLDKNLMKVGDGSTPEELVYYGVKYMSRRRERFSYIAAKDLEDHYNFLIANELIPAEVD